ncbi:MAG: acyl carrier protein [Alphaproteobacteria bacterium]|nr:acyl carrier protein [Alphaproteobacteria bacterium]
MTDAEILSLIQEALNDVAPGREADFAKVRLDSSIEELGLDSIATMEMVGYLEEKVDTTFPDEELAKVAKVSDLSKLIQHGSL